MTQALWNEWVKLSLLGTEHQTRAPQSSDIPAELQNVVNALYPVGHPISNNTREANYLATAGVLCTYQNAGFKAIQLEQDKSQIPPLENEKQRQVSEQYLSTPIMHLFQQIMKLQNPEGLLHTWCQQAVNTGLTIPPAYLLEVIEATQKSDALQASAGRLLGERGQWLAQFRPSWQRILDDSPLTLTTTEATDENIWEDGSLAARCAYLRALRDTDPTQARELLQAVWKQENAKARIALLAEVKTGISVADEELLENCLDDRAKGVRALACELLALLPESAFVQRHTERLEQWLSIEKAGGLLKRKKFTINVNMPDEWDATWERDGIQENAKHIRIGRKASWLEQALRYVAVMHWSKHWEQTPAAVMQASRQSDWAGNLWLGWENSVRLQGCDADWALVLLEQAKHIKRASGHPAWEYLAAGEAERIELENLRKTKGKKFWTALAELNEQMGTHASANVPANWSESFWVEVLNLIERRIKRHHTPSHYSERYALQGALENLVGTGLPDSLLERYQALLHSMIKDNKWEDYVSPTALEIVRLRLQINKQF